MRGDKWGWLVALALSGCAGIGSGTPRRLGAPAHIAYIDDGRLHVIASTGRTVLAHPRKPVMRLPGGRVWDCMYRDPQVHPDGNRVLVIQDCQRQQPTSTRIIEFTLDAPQQAPRTLYEGAGRGLRLPAWSSDSRRVAFLEMDDLVACAADCQMTFRTRIPRPYGNWTQLAWQPDHRRVLLRTEGPKKTTGIAAIEPDAGHFEWLAERLEPAALEQWIADPTHAPVVRALFGSAANPRNPIGWSPDGRRYFYYTGADHRYYWSDWIAGYDTERTRTEHIKTVRRGVRIPPFSWIE